MATRSRIGIQLKDNSVLSVYHHWDGYPEWLGRILTTHYNSREKAAELIDGGDMSVCWTDQKFQNVDGLYQIVENKKGEYGPQYYSERGEDTPPTLHKDQAQFFAAGEEYSYIFRDGEWKCWDMHQFEDDKAPELVRIPEGALAC